MLIKEYEDNGKSLRMDKKIMKFNESNDYEIYVSTYGYYYAECKNNTNATFYKDTLIILPKNMSRLVEDKKEIYKNIKKNNKNSSDEINQLFIDCDRQTNNFKNSKPLNILFIFIDSFSHNHAKRMIPKTYKYLKSFEKDNQIFENYMIIGENTKPNMFPILAGKIAKSMPEYSLNNEDPYTNYQNLQLFWRDFEKLGHVSMYNEDFLVNGNILIYIQ